MKLCSVSVSILSVTQVTHMPQKTGYRVHRATVGTTKHAVKTMECLTMKFSCARSVVHNNIGTF